MENTHLGKASPYIQEYAPELLVAIERAPIRAKLGINTQGMHGVDIWNHWEVSYLDSTGKPQIASLSISYDALSTAIVESKSLKLYFNSLNQSAFESTEKMLLQVKSDLTAIIGSEVYIEALNEQCLDTSWVADYDCIDENEATFTAYSPAPEYLSTVDEQVSESLCSHLFKTNCMVTGQPDWASVFIKYTGAKINHQGLLQYLVSFRNHQAFHEPSCEMIFSDLMRLCKPESLSVYCRYTRRGGIDINPYRSTTDEWPDNLRILRQ